jgi:ABC-type antimicrobial peptide transport system permease subunit
VIAHTALLTILRQMALFAVLGASKKQIYEIYLFLIIINFLLSSVSFLLLPSLLPVVSFILHKLMGVYVVLELNYTMLVLMLSADLLTLLILITIIFLINMRRPLLYLLIDD